MILNIFTTPEQGWIKEDFFQKKIFFFLLLIKEDFLVIKEDFLVIKEDFQSLKIMMTS